MRRDRRLELTRLRVAHLLQMSHSLAWVFEVSGLRPESVFCMSGKSPAGVDYYDAATIRCTNGATIALSGAATIPGHVASSDPDGHGFHLDVRIFGTEGLVSFDIERERLEVRRRDGTDMIVSCRKLVFSFPSLVCSIF